MHFDKFAAICYKIWAHLRYKLKRRSKVDQIRMSDYQNQDASAMKKQAAAVTAFRTLSHCDFASCSLARKNLFQTALRTFKKVPSCDHHQQQHLRRDIIHANYRTQNERIKKNNILEAFLLRSLGKCFKTLSLCEIEITTIKVLQNENSVVFD